jgi:putative PIN family toxin of toxin-antitoxin system
MRIVIDTNILVSAIINPAGFPAQVVEGVLSWKDKALYDDRIIAEYREVLTRPAMGFDPDDVEKTLDGILVSGEYISGIRLDVVLPGESDLPFLEVAVAGFADALITGNSKHFKPRKGRHDVKVMSPAGFVGGPN